MKTELSTATYGKNFQTTALDCLQQLNISCRSLQPKVGRRSVIAGGYGDTSSISPKIIEIEWKGKKQAVSIGWLRNFLKARGFNIPTYKERLLTKETKK